MQLLTFCWPFGIFSLPTPVQQKQKTVKTLVVSRFFLVWMNGLEPTTPCMSTPPAAWKPRLCLLFAVHDVLFLCFVDPLLTWSTHLHNNTQSSPKGSTFGTAFFVFDHLFNKPKHFEITWNNTEHLWNESERPGRKKNWKNSFKKHEKTCRGHHIEWWWSVL